PHGRHPPVHGGHRPARGGRPSPPADDRRGHAPGAPRRRRHLRPVRRAGDGLWTAAARPAGTAPGGRRPPRRPGHHGLRRRGRAGATWRRLRAVRFPVLIPSAALTLAVATPFLALPAAAAPVVRPPSYREALSDAAFTASAPSAPPVSAAPPTPATAVAVQAALQRWTLTQPKVQAIAVAVGVDGHV